MAVVRSKAPRYCILRHEGAANLEERGYGQTRMAYCKTKVAIGYPQTKNTKLT